MKAEIMTVLGKEFDPFTVSLTVGTIQGARLIFHILNHRNLKRLFDSDDGYNRHKGYNKDFSERVCDDNNHAWKEIKEIITSQGYEI